MTINESAAPVTTFLSGVEYYDTNSPFTIDVAGIDNLNQNTQGYNQTDTKNFTVLSAPYGLPTFSEQAWNLTNGTFSGTWTNAYNLMGANFSFDNLPSLISLPLLLPLPALGSVSQPVLVLLLEAS